MANEAAREPTMVQTVTAQMRSVVSDGVGYLTDLLRRIVNGIASFAPVILGSAIGAAGCSSSESDAAVSPTVAAPQALVVDKPAADEGPVPVGKFNITFYYMIGEDEVAAKAAATARKQQRLAAKSSKVANDNHDEVGELASIVVPELVTVYEGKTCDPIAEVSKEFAAQLTLQGTGKLKDGRVLNVWGHCGCERSPCFKVTDSKWGTAGNGKTLQPFRTVAVDPRVVKLGSLLYLPLLEGRTMPGRAPWGGFVHDGCVVADDTGGGIKGNQLDLFVGRRGHYLGISGSGGSHSWARHVPVFDGSKICERKGRKVSRKAGAI